VTDRVTGTRRPVHRRVTDNSNSKTQLDDYEPSSKTVQPNFTFCACCVAWTANGKLTSDSRSSATLVNSSVGFICCTDASRQILWHFKYPRDRRLHVIYNGHSVHPHLRPYMDVTFDDRNGCSHLRISRVILGLAGTYSCLESITGRHKLRFQLIVLGWYGQHVNNEHQ